MKIYPKSIIGIKFKRFDDNCIIFNVNKPIGSNEFDIHYQYTINGKIMEGISFHTITKEILYDNFNNGLWVKNMKINPRSEHKTDQELLSSILKAMIKLKAKTKIAETKMVELSKESQGLSLDDWDKINLKYKQHLQNENIP